MHLRAVCQPQRADARATLTLDNRDWQLEAGGQASVTEGVLSGVLVKPLRLSLESPLRLVTGGVAGRLSLTSGGVVAAAATLPPLSGQVTLAGRSADAELQVSDWGSRLRLSARLPASRSGRDPLATGTLTLASPLVESMSRGLGVTLKGGTLDGEGSADYQLIDSVGDKLYFETNFKAPNNRLIVIDAKNPAQDQWQDVIPETKNVLSAAKGAGFFFANYIRL